MTSAARIAANRRNALASTGPRTSEGKARAAQNAQQSTGPRTLEGKARSARNALRHGLTHSAAGDPAWSEEIKALARAIAGDDANPTRHELACRIAEAQVDVMRARRARVELYPAVVATMGERGDGIVRLAATFDYEGRALARRNRAIRRLDAYDDAVSRERTEPIAATTGSKRKNEANPSPAGTNRENEANPTPVETNRENEVKPTPAEAARENEPNPIPMEPVGENEPDPIPTEAARENEPNPTANAKC
jgi:hypothetical protein